MAHPSQSAHQHQPGRLGQRRGAEPQRAAERTLYGRDIARLDRFVTQAQRAAAQAEREFVGVTIAVDGNGSIRVDAAGMTSMRL